MILINAGQSAPVSDGELLEAHAADIAAAIAGRTVRKSLKLRLCFFLIAVYLPAADALVLLRTVSGEAPTPKSPKGFGRGLFSARR